MINAVGREIPEQIGNYKVRPYTGAYAGEAPTTPIHTLRCAGKSTSDTQKLASSLEEAINAARLFAAGFAETVQNGRGALPE